MPNVMTMNDDGRSLTAAAPLDLSTSQRGSTSSAAAPDRPCCRKETVGSPAPPPTPGFPRKRPADGASLRLPFRKRPIAVEPEERASGDVGRVERFSPATGEAVAPQRRERSAAEGRLPVAGATHMHAKEAERSLEAFPVHVVSSFTYGHCQAYPYPEAEHLSFQHSRDPLRSMALATRQDEDGDTALHIAVVQGKLDLVRQLVRLLQCAGRSLDIYNNLRQTPLHLAVITRQSDVVEALLRAGSDPSSLDRNGQTVLHLCCEYHHPLCLSMVLSLPSSVACLEMKNFQGLSPLHVAVLHGHRDLAAMLLVAGADVNTVDIKSGQSPLILAVESNNAEMVRFLIESGCDVNRPSYSSNTALHSACARGQADVVRVLLKSGADSSLKNYHNDTPVMLAKNKKIADILRGRGSKPVQVPDQHFDMSASPHGTSLMINSRGSPSPSHSRGCSPTMPHCATSHSPRTPPMFAFPFYEQESSCIKTGNYCIPRNIKQ
ncbi:B-cell lymphoma 3 protein [Syngnathus typhle]|uniref:B-cell lymphoma 3 protein n=1 Tax=Syngnathus typhle TaxID=161592 RepID=UPI002A6AE53F|nr:B-cell lymphoma 3 protein [Syngnathus typhle]